MRAISMVVWLCAVSVGIAHAQTSSGTGFLVNKAGWVLTNAHVVEGCADVSLPDGRVGRVSARDERNDLALVRFSAFPDAVPFTFRQTPPRLVEDVVALGFPLAGVLAGGIKATTGSVNALAGVNDDPARFQFSAPIQPGNSGGPVIDRSGLVVGVTVSRLSEERFAGVQNVNFAVKALVATAFMTREGIVHSTANPPPDPEPLTDIVERAVTATLQLQCDQRTPSIKRAIPEPAPKPAAQAPPALPFIVVERQDIVGFDYVQRADTSLVACAAACEGDPRCRAFTFNTRHNHCLLKDGAAYLASHPDAISAYRRALSSQVRRSTIAVYPNVDAPGGDYARIRRSTYVACFLECADNARCRAFSYVRQTRDCWLKDRVGRPVASRGVEYGIK